MTTTPEHVRETLGNYVKAWATADKALLLSLFAENAIFCDPVGAPPFLGHAGIGRLWDFAHLDPGTLHQPQIEEIRVNANEGILRFTMRVRAPARQQGLDITIIDWFELNGDGRIQNGRAFWDASSVSVPEGMTPLSADMPEPQG